MKNHLHTDRWAYRTGAALGRASRKVKGAELRLAQRAQAAGIPNGALLVRGGLAVMKLTIVLLLLFAGFWLLASLVVLAGMMLIVLYRAHFDLPVDIPGANDVSHPDHRSHWPEFYDKWGSHR